MALIVVQSALAVVVWISAAAAAAAAMTSEEIIWMKSNSPDVPVLTDRKSVRLHHRVRRGTSGSRLTYEERVEFLRVHNDFRKNVIPTASDMQFVVWHEELASMAQEWADGCEWKHGNPTRDPPPFSYVGQNLHATTAKTVTGTESTTSWYNEVQDYNYDTNSCAENKVCGHYTQVVWATSNNIGCAIADCPELIGTTMNNAKFTVCNYGPGGNIVGVKPYKSGVKCSECPSGTTCDLDLCAPDPRCGSKSCQNNGTLDIVSCECNCPDGYDGATCTEQNGTSRLTESTSLLLAALLLTISTVVSRTL